MHVGVLCTNEYLRGGKSEWDFSIGTDSFSDLSIHSSAKGAFYYFYHDGQHRRITDFVIDVGRDVSTLCNVKLIKKDDHFEPRIRFWKRNNKLRTTKEGDVKLSDEIRHMKASVDTSKGTQGLWQLIGFLQACQEIDLPTVEFAVAEGADVALLKSLRSGRVAAGQLEAIATAIRSSPETSRTLARTDAGAAIARMVEHQRHLDFLDELEKEVKDPASNENKVQKLLRGQGWIFGGRYMGEADRRRLTTLDEFDIPLLRADGTLHIVELKTPVAEDLIVKHRNHWIIGPGFQEAIAQVTYYLRTLDEHRSTILTDLGIDCRRAFATVVVGHSAHTAHDAAKIGEVLRTHGSRGALEVLAAVGAFDHVLRTS